MTFITLICTQRARSCQNQPGAFHPLLCWSEGGENHCKQLPRPPLSPQGWRVGWAKPKSQALEGLPGMVGWTTYSTGSPGSSSGRGVPRVAARDSLSFHVLRLLPFMALAPESPLPGSSCCQEALDKWCQTTCPRPPSSTQGILVSPVLIPSTLTLRRQGLSLRLDPKKGGEAGASSCLLVRQGSRQQMSFIFSLASEPGFLFTPKPPLSLTPLFLLLDSLSSLAPALTASEVSLIPWGARDCWLSSNSHPPFPP